LCKQNRFLQQVFINVTANEWKLLAIISSNLVGQYLYHIFFMFDKRRIKWENRLAVTRSIKDIDSDIEAKGQRMWLLKS